MTFVPDIQADEESGDVFKNTRSFQLPTVQGTNAGNLGGELANDSIGFWNIPTDDYVTFDLGVPVQYFSGGVVERGHNRRALGNKFSGFLGG